MIGIVLWSDAKVGKAVIWCEDQGDLAFYSHVGTFDDFAICVGDWVLFNMILEDDLRLATDIEVLHESGRPSLALDLTDAVEGMQGEKAMTLVGENEGALIRLGAKGAASRASTLGGTASVAVSPLRAAVHETTSKPAQSSPLSQGGAGGNIVTFPFDPASRQRRA